jgi:hypothetical protein
MKPSHRIEHVLVLRTPRTDRLDGRITSNSNDRSGKRGATPSDTANARISLVPEVGIVENPPAL